MIKTNTIVALLAVCALLGIGFFVIQSERPVVGVPTRVGENLVKDLNTDSIRGITIKKAGVQVDLEKKDKAWTLTSHKNRPAKADRIEALLSNVKAARLEETRRGSDELFALDEKGRAELTLKLESGDKTLYIGKSPDWNKSFVRTEPKGEIFEIDKGLDGDAGIRVDKEERILDPSHFYDLKIFGFNADDVIDISITRDGKTTRAQRTLGDKHEPIKPKQELKAEDKPAWRLTAPENLAADEAAVNSIASTLASLNAKSYADGVEEKDRGLDKPGAQVKLVLKDGTEQNLTFGKMEGEDVILAVGGKSDPYKVYKFVFENVTKDLKKKDDEKKHEASGATPTPHGAPVPPIPQIPAKTDDKKPAPSANSQATPPPPPPPPVINAPDAKPVLPPAVVKQPDENAKKIEQKK